MPHYFVSIWYQNVSLISHCWKWPITGHRNLVPIYLKVRQLLFQVSILFVKKLFSPLTINVVTVHPPSVANLNKTAEKINSIVSSIFHQILVINRSFSQIRRCQTSMGELNALVSFSNYNLTNGHPYHISDSLSLFPLHCKYLFSTPNSSVDK